MSEAVLHPGPLTAEMVARAVVAASAEYQVDPQMIYARGPKDGRGAARLLAAVALIHPVDRPIPLCAKVMAVLPQSMAPSQLARRKISPEAIERVRSLLKACPAAPPLPVEARARRGEPGWVDPRRDVAREERILAARRQGTAPAEIAKAEGLSVSATKALLAKSGEVFPVVKPGPKAEARETVAAPARAKAPRPTTPRAPKPPALVAPPPPPPVLLEPFPDDHPTWAPLPGSNPVRLIDHTKGCRWPVTVADRREPMVCDLTPVPGSPYCERHRWLGASPAVRDTLTRPSDLPAAPRMAASADADVLSDEAA